MNRATAAIALGIMLLLAGCSVGYQPAADTSPPSESTNGDHLGYYNGYWYNDTFDIDPSDGLTEAEEEAIFSRAIARVQLLRGLELQDDVEIELMTREKFRETQDGVFPDPEGGVRTLDNAQHEATFLVGPDTDVVEVRRGNRGGLIQGFYQPSSERIVVVSERDPATLTRHGEIILAHELLHALQDQHFGLGEVESDGTLDGVNARNGLIEGDAVVIEREYERNCETGEWQCIALEDETAESGPPAGFHWGVYFAGFFPYAEGPSFIDHHQERGGWDAIDAMYDEPPTAAAEVIYPATYGADAYGNATVEDRNASDWERVRTDGGVDYARVGQSGLTAMFVYTDYERAGEGVVDRDEFLNRDDDGTLNDTRPFTYDISYAEGWYADRLHAYEGEGETAHVWNVTFTDRANATEFYDGYQQVLEFWGGERVDTGETTETWRFDEDGEFHGAVWIQRDGNSLVVVQAPSEEDLEDVYEPAR